MIAVTGLTWETVSIQPWSRSRGTYTGDVIRMRKTGSCIAGAAWRVRIRVIIPAAKRNAATLTISARPTSPKRSIPPPPISSPVARAIAKTIAQTNTVRTRAATP